MKGKTMILFLHYLMARDNLTALEVFQTAYKWKYRDEGDVSNDYCQFLLHGILPAYVSEYLTILKRIWYVHFS